ncbi:MAG: FAD-binding protein, partial [Clostridiales bacterium]|nr:FAD-binding protein [Clostridiales bacterium]
MYTPEMLASIERVEATRAARMGVEPQRMTAQEKDDLLNAYHPDFKLETFSEIKVGPNKGDKAPMELAALLHGYSRIPSSHINLERYDYDVDVLVIGGGGAGSSAAIEAHNAGANVMIVTKLRI